jgi:hypothetical protein
MLASLKDSKHAGFQTDNGGFHNDAYKAAAARIEAEVQNLPSAPRIGAPKTADNTRTRYTAVSLIWHCTLLSNELILVCRSKRSMHVSNTSAISVALAGIH